MVAVLGFNGAVMAYGQASSGKTHSIYGSLEAPGLIRLVLQEVFRRITTSESELDVKISVVEVYGHKVFDLLSVEVSALTQQLLFRPWSV